MPVNHKIIFYPVGNGDTCQIILKNSRRILFDFCHRRNAEDSTDKRIDLKKQLMNELNEAERNYFDVVAFTHADTDHISGCTDFFHLNHAAKYQGDERIQIKELWVPASLLLEKTERDNLSSEFAILRSEARFRLLEGNGIKVFSKPYKLVDQWLRQALANRNEPENARDHLFVDAGALVEGFNLSSDGAEFFCHSPFIKHCDEGNDLRNDAALIFNVRLRSDGCDYDFMQIGDSTWEVLEDIVSISKRHNNEDRLMWNIINIPHHCSYLALSDEKGEHETQPKPLVRELLLHGKKGAYMVSSSGPILNSPSNQEASQPPHIQAKKSYNTYLSQIEGRRFLVTMEEPTTLLPKPLIFDITNAGVSWLSSAISTGVPGILERKPPRAGVRIQSNRE